MLMGANDGAVEHRVFIIGIGGQMLKYPFPDAGFSRRSIVVAGATADH
jgi:hypothetical protein